MLVVDLGTEVYVLSFGDFVKYSHPWKIRIKGCCVSFAVTLFGELTWELTHDVSAWLQNDTPGLHSLPSLSFIDINHILIVQACQSTAYAVFSAFKP